VLVGAILLRIAVLLVSLVDSMLVLVAMSPLAIIGLHTLAYAGGEWRRRIDERGVR
jgi:hypothetical protein